MSNFRITNAPSNNDQCLYDVEYNTGNGWESTRAVDMNAANGWINWRRDYWAYCTANGIKGYAAHDSFAAWWFAQPGNDWR